MTDRRMISLDVARGLAALTVAIYHWEHFYLAPAAANAPIRAFPLRGILGFVYENGAMGVDFFFALSGTIFVTVYGSSIENGMSAWRFGVLRFSRLYPAYLLTLLIVAALQAIAVVTMGSAIYYHDDTPTRFVLCLLMVQNWLGPAHLAFDWPFVFNVPAWSTSVEIVLYALFFAVFRFVRMTGPIALLAIACGGLSILILTDQGNVGRGLWCFFLGATVARCVAYQYFKLVVGIATVLLFTISISLPPGLWSYWFHTLYFAALIGVLIAWDSQLSRFARPLRWLGDISYSAYLTHFPLQIVIILTVFSANGVYTVTPFESAWMLAAYISLLAGFSALMHYQFEVPMRTALRRRLLNYPAAPAPDVAFSAMPFV